MSEHRFIPRRFSLAWRSACAVALAKAGILCSRFLRLCRAAICPRFLSSLFCAAAFGAVGILAAQNTPPGAFVATKPVYVPDTSRQWQHLDDSVLAWDATMKTTNVLTGTASAHFVFNFTNIAEEIDRTLETNVTTVTWLVKATNQTSLRNKACSPTTRLTTATNIFWRTNSVTPVPVSILDVHPSCGCTTAQLPTLPWTLPPGTNASIGVTVNLAGKFGTVVKTVHVRTDEGSRDLVVQITILPSATPVLTDAERIRQMAIAKVDREAVFKNDCATCHLNPGQFKYGKPLYDADCAICHEAAHRASMVPDLRNLKVPTNEDFWRTWIAHGKPGTFMPAFATSDGGPLNDMQIASLAAYLNAAIPSHVPSPQ